MKQTRKEKRTDNSEEKKRERSRDKEIMNDKEKLLINTAENNNTKTISTEKNNNIQDIIDKVRNIQKNQDYFSLEKCVNQYDNDNLLFLKENNNSEEFKKLKDDLNESIIITPIEKQENFSNQLKDLINSINKSDVQASLPKLPYGHHLTDSEFIDLMKQCIICQFQFR